MRNRISISAAALALIWGTITFAQSNKAIPSITAHPTSQTVTAGQTATFSVTATAPSWLHYQWQKNGTVITGATSASYTTPATTSADNGAVFVVIVSNGPGSVTSDAATLTVNPSAVAPTITTQLANQTVTAGQTATFTVAATGTAPLSYQWRKNGLAIGGATLASYTTPATTSTDNGAVFVVVVTNSAANATSNTAKLTVNAALVAPMITTQPANQTLTAGQTATFTVAATGTSPLSYQWQKNGVTISGATSASYTTPATTSTDNGAAFVVVVSNSAGNATSNAATLTVNPSAVAPTITTQPANQTVTAGQTATFTVAATGTASLSYQWQKNSANISGATSSSYTTSATAATDNGAKFDAVVSNSAGSVTSSAATLTVNPAAVAPTITTQPANQIVIIGQTATFSVVANGTAPLSYQWQKNGVAMSGATSASYTTPAATSGDNSSMFAVVVSNSAGSVTSSAATLTVNPSVVAPTITTQPANETVTAGQTATFTVAANGTEPLSYQWQKNGVAISGATSTSYTTSATTSTDNSAVFVVVVSNSAGNATSNGATLTVLLVGSGTEPTYANNGSGCPINTVAGGPTDSVTSYNCPLPNPTGAGNLLVIFVRYLNTNTPTITFTDNIGGNTYSQAAACVDASNNTQSRLYYVQNVAAGVNVVTVHFSASTGRVQMDPYEFYNVSKAAALDSAACQVGGATSLSSGALSPLSVGDLVMQFGHADNGVAIGSCTVGSQGNITWKMRSALIGSNEPMCAQYGIYNSTASFNPTMTFNTSVNYISLAAAFKAASAGTPPPSGIRVAYVQHDDGGQEQNASFAVLLPVSGNLIAELTSAGCLSNTLSSCPYPTSLSDGANPWTEVGPTYVSSTGSSREAVGSIWYAKNVQPGLYPLAITMNPAPTRTYPLSWIMYDIVGASSNPLDTGFGGAGNGLASISTVNNNGPVTTFTATPSVQNEVILAEAGYDWDTFTGLGSPVGAQFLSATYDAETNFSWCDLNGGWGLLYNGSSVASETWTWTHDTSSQAGAGRGLALGVAFMPASQ
jgi:Immunoglobulin I-set domain